MTAPSGLQPAPEDVNGNRGGAAWIRTPAQEMGLRVVFLHKEPKKNGSSLVNSAAQHLAPW